MTSRSLLWPRRLATLAAGALILVGIAGSGPAAGADEPAGAASYEAVAHADAFAVEAYDAGAPVIPPNSPVLFGSPASTHAVLDSLGTSSAFAGAPYPGELALSLLPTVNGFLLLPNGLPALPPYPFYVATSFPLAPTADRRAPGSVLHSESSKDASRADATSGGGLTGGALLSSRTLSSVARDPASGGMVAEAQAVIDSLTIEPGLHVANIASHLKITGTPGTKPAVEQKFSVGTITVGDVTVGATPDGVVLTSGQPPVSAPDLAPVNAALAPSGVTLEYFPAKETPISVESAGLAIRWSREVPNRGLMKFALIVGRVSVVANTGASAPQSSIGHEAAEIIASPEPATAPVTEASGIGSLDSSSIDTVISLPGETADTGASEMLGRNQFAHQEQPPSPPNRDPSQLVAAPGGPAHSAPTAAFKPVLGHGSGTLYGTILLGGVALLAGTFVFGRAGSARAMSRTNHSLEST